MAEIFKDSRLTVGFGRGVSGRPADEEKLTPAERRLLEQVAEKLLAEHGETLKKLGDE